MNNLDINFWKTKKVFVTGHTGFKGGWLISWLKLMGASIYGYSRAPETTPNIFEVANLQCLCDYSEIGDVADLSALKAALERFKPEVVIHLAAQSLVRYSYLNPIETYATNVMGTVNVLEAIRQVNSVQSVLVITSDKCYENTERSLGYKESDPMGGFDPYSSSKGCAELVASAYRRSFFKDDPLSPKVNLATCRAGNVIGGGDWSRDRLIPDAIAAFEAHIPLKIRHPAAVRPWQHVLEPLSGYLLLAQELSRRGDEFEGPWNFGPAKADTQSVQAVIEIMGQIWGQSASWELDAQDHPHEAHYLRLDCSKSMEKLGWSPRWGLEQALSATIDWQRAFRKNSNMTAFMEAQIQAYLRS